MSLSWSAAFRCGTCRTVVRFRDEAPPWRDDERQVALMEEAKQWCATNPDARVPLFATAPDIDRFASLLVIGFGGLIVAKVRDDLDLRVIDCPSCGGVIPVANAEP